jgi:hypothetical protein
MKKETIVTTLESAKGVVARCEYLGTERTEIIREYQKDLVSGDYKNMRDLYLAVVEAQTALESALNAYLLKLGNNRVLNFDALRQAVKAFAEEHKANGFLAYFDERYTAESISDVYFSISVLATKIGGLYTDYMKTKEDAANVRKGRERLADRKARLLAELAKIEEEESK